MSVNVNIEELFKGQLDWHEAINSNFGAVKNAIIDAANTSVSIVENLSDEFSEEKDYEVGDYCIYLNKLFKFTQQKSAGPWDGSIVIPTILSQEIKNNSRDISKLNESLGQGGVHTYYDTAQECMNDILNWMLNIPEFVMDIKFISCGYTASSESFNISGEIYGGPFLLIGFRSGTYASVVAHSYWKDRAVSVATIENGIWAKRFERVITSSDLRLKLYIVPKPFENNSIFTSLESWGVYIYKSGKVVMLRLNIYGNMLANNENNVLFTLPTEYIPIVDIVVNYVTQKGTTMLLGISKTGEFYLNNIGKTVNNDWICRQQVTYVTDN